LELRAVRAERRDDKRHIAAGKTESGNAEGADAGVTGGLRWVAEIGQAVLVLVPVGAVDGLGVSRRVAVVGAVLEDLLADEIAERHTVDVGGRCRIERCGVNRKFAGVGETAKM